MAKLRTFEIGKYYHIYSRGVNKCIVFLKHNDYKRFEKYLEICNTKENIKIPYTKKYIHQNDEGLVKIYAYCLMPNHFHLVAEELVEGGISLFLQKVLSGYVTYFNKRYSRTGTLFGSRFKDKIIDTDIYFKQLMQYIWNNPVKLINSEYDSAKLLRGEILLTEKEILFAKNYPYKFFLGRSGTAPT